MELHIHIVRHVLMLHTQHEKHVRIKLLPFLYAVTPVLHIVCMFQFTGLLEITIFLVVGTKRKIRLKNQRNTYFSV